MGRGHWNSITRRFKILEKSWTWISRHLFFAFRINLERAPRVVCWNEAHIKSMHLPNGIKKCCLLLETLGFRKEQHFFGGTVFLEIFQIHSKLILQRRHCPTKRQHYSTTWRDIVYHFLDFLHYSTWLFSQELPQFSFQEFWAAPSASFWENQVFPLTSEQNSCKVIPVFLLCPNSSWQPNVTKSQPNVMKSS